MVKPENDDTVSGTSRRNQSGNANMKKGKWSFQLVTGKVL